MGFSHTKTIHFWGTRYLRTPQIVGSFPTPIVEVVYRRGAREQHPMVKADVQRELGARVAHEIMKLGATQLQFCDLIGL